MATFADIAGLRKQLDEVDAAIAAARTGASYSIDGTTMTRQDLPQLRDERTRIQRELKETEAVLEGARNPGVVIASWHR